MPEAAQFDHLSFDLVDEEALLDLRERLKNANCEVTDVVDHGFIRSIYFTDPNGIALEASYWIVDPTGHAEVSFDDPRLFGDPNPVPALREFAAGGLDHVPATKLVDGFTKEAEDWVVRPARQRVAARRPPRHARAAARRGAVFFAFANSSPNSPSRLRPNASRTFGNHFVFFFFDVVVDVLGEHDDLASYRSSDGCIFVSSRQVHFTPWCSSMLSRMSSSRSGTSAPHRRIEDRFFDRGVDESSATIWATILSRPGRLLLVRLLELAEQLLHGFVVVLRRVMASTVAPLCLVASAPMGGPVYYPDTVADAGTDRRSDCPGRDAPAPRRRVRVCRSSRRVHCRGRCCSSGSPAGRGGPTANEAEPGRHRLLRRHDVPPPTSHRHGAASTMRNGDNDDLISAAEIEFEQIGDVRVMQDSLSTGTRTGRPNVAMQWMGGRCRRTRCRAWRRPPSCGSSKPRTAPSWTIFHHAMIDHHAGGLHMAEHAAHTRLSDIRKIAEAMAVTAAMEIDELNHVRQDLGLPIHRPSDGVTGKRVAVTASPDTPERPRGSRRSRAEDLLPEEQVAREREPRGAAEAILEECGGAHPRPGRGGASDERGKRGSGTLTSMALTWVLGGNQPGHRP